MSRIFLAVTIATFQMLSEFRIIIPRFTRARSEEALDKIQHSFHINRHLFLNVLELVSNFQADLPLAVISIVSFFRSRF